MMLPETGPLAVPQDINTSRVGQPMMRQKHSRSKRQLLIDQDSFETLEKFLPTHEDVVSNVSIATTESNFTTYSKVSPPLVAKH
jgi:hypothetical protein